MQPEALMTPKYLQPGESELTERLGKPPETSQLVTLTLKYGWVWV